MKENNNIKQNEEMEAISIDEKVKKLKKENKILLEKVNTLEKKFKDKPKETIKKKIDIRIIMLILSLIGLITTAIYLFYKD